MYLVDCHGMQQLAGRVMGVTRSGIRASSSQEKIPMLVAGAAVGAHIGAFVGGVAVGGALLKDGFSSEAPLLLILAPFGGAWGMAAGAFLGGAYGITWPVSAPVTVGVIVYSHYQKKKRDYEKRM